MSSFRLPITETRLRQGAEAERAAIVALCRDMGSASVSMILAAGLPGGTRTQRVKRAAYADGYTRAIADVRDAIERGDHLKEKRND